LLILQAEKKVSAVVGKPKKDNQDESFASMVDTLVNSSAAPAFWKDMNGIYRSINNIGVDFYNLVSKEHVIGKTDYELFPKDVADRYTNVDHKAVKEMQQTTELEELATASGDHVFLLTKKLPLIHHGTPMGVLAFAEDVTKEHQLTAKLAVINKNAGELVTTLDTSTAIKHVLQDMLGYYGADRAYISKINREKSTVSCTYETCRPGVKEVSGGLQNQPLAQVPFWYKDFGKKGYVLLKDIRDLKDAEAADLKRLSGQGVTSLICAPIRQDKQTVGFIGVDNMRDHINDADLLITLGNYIASEIMRQNINQNYKKAAEENNMLLNNSPVAICICRYNGRDLNVKFANEGCYRVFSSGRSWLKQFQGNNLIDLVYPEDRPIVIGEWNKMRGNRMGHVFNANFRVFSEYGKKRWVNCVARYSHDDKDGFEVYYASLADISKQMQAEEEIAEGEQHHAALLRHLPANFIVSRVLENGKLEPYVYSSEFCRMMGGSESECMEFYHNAEGWHHGCHPDDAAMVKETFAAHRHDSTPTSIIYRIRNLKGQYIWFSVSFMYTEIGGMHFLYQSFTNVDELKKNEEENEKTFRSQQIYLDSVADQYLSMMRADLTYDRVETLSGDDLLFDTDFSDGSYTTAYEIVGRSLMRESEREEFSSLFSRNSLLMACEAGTTTVKMQYYSRRMNGSPLWVELTATIMRRPGSSSTIAFFSEKDINSQKIRDVILNDIIAQRYDYIAYIRGNDNSAKLISTSSSTSSMMAARDTDNFELTMSAIVKKFVVPEETAECAKFLTLSNVYDELKDKDACDFYCTVKAPNGEMRYKKFKFTYLDRSNKILALLCSDYTGMKKRQDDEELKLKAALQEAEQANFTKSEFLSHMSHEIRTPMNAIIGLTNISLAEPGLTSELKDHLTKIRISSHTLLSLINDILDMSRIESGRLTLHNDVFNFEPFINGICTVISLQCNDKGLHFECIIDGPIDDAYIGDRSKLQQVLINILGNSVKFTDRDGQVQMMVRQLSDDGENVRLRFVIVDTGKGIDDEFMARIFDPFSQDLDETRSQSGTGLGLAICRHVVNLMGGNITVSSSKGKGSRFTVDVGLGKTKKDMKHPADMTPIYLKDLKVLLVSSTQAQLEQAQLALKKSGAGTDCADSCSEAVAKIKENHEAGNDFDLMLLDWNMPDSDSHETAAQAREISDGKTTIIIMTSYEWADLKNDTAKEKPDLFISKPLYTASITQTIEQAISSRTAPADESDAEFKGMRCLLAEDNEINMEIAKLMLERKGFDVDSAMNGAEAVEKFSGSKPGCYSAVLMDISMPVMDGLDATRAIRQLKRDDAKTVPVLAMTANAFSEDINKSIEAGINTHLTKPIEPELLYEALRKYISDKKPAAGKNKTRTKK
jgi:two-component system sensor histidine kinase/response regulator